MHMYRPHSSGSTAEAVTCSTCTNTYTYLTTSAPMLGVLLVPLRFFFFTQMKTPTRITMRTMSTRTPPTAPPTAGIGKLDPTILSTACALHSMSPRFSSSTEHSGSTFSWTPWTTTVGLLASTHPCSIIKRSVLFILVVLTILPWSITFCSCSELQTSLPFAIYSVVRAQLHNSVRCRDTCCTMSDNFSNESCCCIWRAIMISDSVHRGNGCCHQALPASSLAHKTHCREA